MKVTGTDEGQVVRRGLDASRNSGCRENLCDQGADAYADAGRCASCDEPAHGAPACTLRLPDLHSVIAA